MEGERLREADASHRMNMNEYTGVAAGGAAPASPLEMPAVFKAGRRHALELGPEEMAHETAAALCADGGAAKWADAAKGQTLEAVAEEVAEVAEGEPSMDAESRSMCEGIMVEGMKWAASPTFGNNMARVKKVKTNSYHLN